jgi:hypothetical protein
MMDLGSSATLAMNIITVWLLLEAYLLKPRGFHGEPWFVVMAYVVTAMAFVLLALNVFLWTLGVLRLWMTNGT